MYYRNITHGIFRARLNRFVAEVETVNGIELVHVKNTGRCKELLVPGYTVYLEASENPNRKTRYDLVAVKRDNLLINMDAQAPNQVFAEWAMDGHFLDGLTFLRSEYRWGQSRFDFYWEAGTRKGLVEVKGCTLEKAGLTLFPDAPTERGVKHLHELTRAVSEGFECTLCIVIQMKGVPYLSSQ